MPMWPDISEIVGRCYKQSVRNNLIKLFLINPRVPANQ